MIDNDEQLAIVRRQVERMESVLAGLKRDVQPKNEANFRILAEAPANQLVKLRREIDEYIGFDAQLRERVEADDFQEVSGILRQVDLDSRTFTLRDRGDGLPDLTCEYGRYLDAEVKSRLDARVVVFGRLRTSDKSQRQTMEVDTFETKAASRAIEQPTAPSIRPQGAA